MSEFTTDEQSLVSMECEACRGGMPPLKGPALQEWQLRLGDSWAVVDEHHLEKVYKFEKDFAEALAFTNRVGELAEAQNHHPDIHLSWGKVTVIVWTHKIDGLTVSDFVFAAKTDALQDG